MQERAFARIRKGGSEVLSLVEESVRLRRIDICFSFGVRRVKHSGSAEMFRDAWGRCIRNECTDTRNVLKDADWVFWGAVVLLGVWVANDG